MKTEKPTDTNLGSSLNLKDMQHKIKEAHLRHIHLPLLDPITCFELSNQANRFCVLNRGEKKSSNEKKESCTNDY